MSFSPSSSTPGLLDGAVGANHWGILGNVAVKVKLLHSREASNADPGGQSERLRKRRQSGVMDLDGSLGRSCISNVGENVG